jgi:hypothetical protein
MVSLWREGLLILFGSCSGERNSVVMVSFAYATFGFFSVVNCARLLLVRASEKSCYRVAYGDAIISLRHLRYSTSSAPIIIIAVPFIPSSTLADVLALCCSCGTLNVLDESRYSGISR